MPTSVLRRPCWRTSSSISSISSRSLRFGEVGLDGDETAVSAQALVALRIGAFEMQNLSVQDNRDSLVAHLQSLAKLPAGGARPALAAPTADKSVLYIGSTQGVTFDGSAPLVW